MKTSSHEQRGVNSCLSAALDYATRGWRVIPIHSISGGGCSCLKSECKSAGKHPRTEHGQKDASTGPDTIQGWWNQWPQANVGIVTGALSGLVVLDVDPRHGGPDSLSDLEARHGDLPQTARTRTGGGGTHVLFAHPGGTVKNKAGFAPGLDVRGDGGYIVAPPSRHASGDGYEWAIHPDDVLLAPIPEWLLAVIKGDGQADVRRADSNGPNGHRLYSELAMGVIGEGSRNAALTSLGGYLRSAGFAGDMIAVVLKSVNAERCDPPLNDDEVEGIAQSVCRYQPDLPLGIGAIGSYPPPTNNNNGSLIVGSEVDYKVNAKILRDEVLASGVVELPYLPLLDQRGYLVEGWTHLIAGYPKVGKTQLLVQLCMSWAPRTVLYITEEPKQVWGYRLATLEEWEHGTILPAMGLPPQQILHEICSASEDIVVIDTVRLLRLKDENDNSALAAQLFPVIAACRAEGKTLILVHHTRKGGGDHGEGIAGGHAFMGAVDIAIEIRWDRSKNRRLVKAYGRAGIGGDFLYEMRADGLMVPFGKPTDIGLKEVKQKALAVLTSKADLKTSQILEEIEPPRPSSEQLRLALIELAMDGEIQRDPPTSEEARGKTPRWRLASPIEMGAGS